MPADDGAVAEIFGLIEALDQAPDIATFRERALAARELIPGDSASFDEVCTSSGSVVIVASDPRLMQPGVVAAYRRLRPGHPVVAHGERTGDLRSRAISQLVSEEEFRQSPLYRELFADLGVLDQLILPIPHHVATVGLVISRSSWGFGEAELVLAERLRRLLTIAYRWQLEHEAIRIGVPLTRACAETAGEQVLLSDQHGDVLLPEGTPAELEPGLQSAVSHAVSIALRNPVSSSPDRPLVELTMQLTASEEISLRVLPRRPGSDLLPVVIDRSPAMLRPAELSRHGLTPRQSDVMALILRGETTAGIANELGISPKTVEKHIESAYRALGAQSRTEALLVLLGGSRSAGVTAHAAEGRARHLSVS